MTVKKVLFGSGPADSANKRKHCYVAAAGMTLLATSYRDCRNRSEPINQIRAFAPAAAHRMRMWCKRRRIHSQRGRFMQTRCNGKDIYVSCPRHIASFSYNSLCSYDVKKNAHLRSPAHCAHGNMCNNVVEVRIVTKRPAFKNSCDG